MKTFTSSQLKIILVIICFMITVFLFNNFPFFAQSGAIEEEKHPSIAVEIVGEIEKPGIYCFEHKVNLGKVIERAGGLKNNVVLAKDRFLIEVSNGAKITIGSSPFSLIIEMMKPEKRLLYFIPININTASVEGLVVVPGIGEKTASAIIRYRHEHGDFLSLDGLRKVPGIGRRNFRRMKAYLRT